MRVSCYLRRATGFALPWTIWGCGGIGAGVNIAARLEAARPVGSICVSRPVWQTRSLGQRRHRSGGRPDGASAQFDAADTDPCILAAAEPWL